MTDETMEPRTTRLRTLSLVTFGLLIGVGGTLLLRPNPKNNPAHEAAAKKQMYQCPMHPQIIVDHQTPCPICGMDLVPMEGEGASGAHTDTHATITIDPEHQQLIGLKTEKVREGSVSGELRAAARVVVDETRVRKVNVKVEGFVEKLFVAFTGKLVAKGEPLFSLYSPEFVSTQREFLLALKTQKALAGGTLQNSGGDLLEAAKRRLTLWDVPPETLERLEKTGEEQRVLTLRSPLAGVVTAKNIVEGARLTPSETPYEITDLSRVWVLVEIYETELGRAKVGMPADLTLPAFPGRSFQGHVAFVDPSLDPKTRTARLRLEFPNTRGELKPEMFGEVLLKGQGRKGLIIPLDAVLDSGTAKVVFVALGNGKFEPREVSVGSSLGERIEIRSGLEVGNEVVTHANFLVDSESRLKSALQQMSQKSAPAPSGHSH